MVDSERTGKAGFNTPMSINMFEYVQSKERTLFYSKPPYGFIVASVVAQFFFPVCKNPSPPLLDAAALLFVFALLAEVP